MAIEFDGNFTVTASREEAYAVLSDPQKFAPLLPTYQDLTMKENGSADVTVKIGVGKIRGSAVVNLTLEESEAPVRAAYVGKGKVMGSAFNMGTAFELEDAEGGGTLIKWHGDVTMFGKLVALAGGLLKPIAKKDITRLIDAIREALSPADESAAV